MSDPIQVTASGSTIGVTVSGGIGPQGPQGPAGAGGVTSLQALTGAVTLAVVGGSIAVAGQTITLTVTGGGGGSVAWDDVTGKPATFTPAAHNQAWSTITSTPTTIAGYGITDAVTTSDSRLTDSREWSAATVTQADAEAGTSTSRAAFTPLRVFQAIAAWWTASAAATKLAGIATGATANQTDAYLLARANHTGTQAAGTITGLGGSASLNVGTSAGTVAAGDHTHSQLHDRPHAITSSSDHTATAWRVWYSNGSGVVTELALGAAGTALVSNGASAAPSFGTVAGGVTVTTPTTLAADQNDYASATGDINRIASNGSTARTITGVAAGTSGQVILLTNVGTANITLKHQSTSSTAANRIIVPWAGDCVIAADASVALCYDATSSRWRVL